MTRSEKTKQEKVQADAGTYARNWQAAVDLTEGSTQAIASGFRAFGNKLEVGKILDVSADTGLVGAVLTGYVSYFDSMAKVARDVAGKFRQTGSGT
jgi:hypothetical protein